MRENSEEEFHEIFEEISSVAQDVGIEIGISRLAGRQIHRNIVQAETPEGGVLQDQYIRSVPGSPHHAA